MTPIQFFMALCGALGGVFTLGIFLVNRSESKTAKLLLSADAVARHDKTFDIIFDKLDTHEQKMDLRFLNFDRKIDDISKDVNTIKVELQNKVNRL